MDKNALIELIRTALGRVSQRMIGHEGIDFIIKSRLKFEKWIQVELLKELVILTREIQSLKLENEYPVSTKNSKKGKTIDLVILSNSTKLAAIELKIIPTSYDCQGFKKSTKSMPESIKEMISDLNKSINDNFLHAFSIGFVFPLPLNPNHRNNLKDFVKQERLLRSAGDLLILDSELSNSFSSKYYILSNLIDI
jgi:hypothetical protein